jgi:hypothetical protein
MDLTSRKVNIASSSLLASSSFLLLVERWYSFITDLDLSPDLGCYIISIQEFVSLYQTGETIVYWPWHTVDSVVKCQVDRTTYATMFQQETETGRVVRLDEMHRTFHPINESEGIVSFVSLIDPPITLGCYTPRNLDLFHIKRVNGEMFFLHDEVGSVEFGAEHEIEFEGIDSFSASTETKKWNVHTEIPAGKWMNMTEYLGHPQGVPLFALAKIDLGVPIFMFSMRFSCK